MLLSSEHAARATFYDTAWGRRHEDEARLLETGDDIRLRYRYSRQCIQIINYGHHNIIISRRVLATGGGNFS